MVWPAHSTSGGEVHSHPRSCSYKYYRAVGGYPDGSTSLQTSFIHLRNRCHIELLHFPGLKGALHDICSCPMSFGMSVYIRM
ncbi:hypothetical protein GDO78_010851 [Eleutherodactylus coqui]|uniref:Uncharacterized protein n=1 Tax=Eleutherodactylus coqui TaxID=57060 RepID=A0A8J6F5D8_ELECQ|nr:hypothetical protein GDO78_010851 [Eleutherodactylus coqui]